MNQGSNIHIEKVSGSVTFNQQIGDTISYEHNLSEQHPKKKSLKVIVFWIGFVSSILSITGYFGYHLSLKESNQSIQGGEYLQRNSTVVSPANPPSSASIFNVADPPLTRNDFAAIDRETRVKIYNTIILAKEQRGLQNIFDKEIDAYNLLPDKYKNIVFVNYEDSYTKIQRLDTLFLTLKIRRL